MLLIKSMMIENLETSLCLYECVEDPLKLKFCGWTYWVIPHLIVVVLPEEVAEKLFGHACCSIRWRLWTVETKTVDPIVRVREKRC
jgi:hypothetical protein